MKLTNYNELETYELILHIQKGDEMAFRYLYDTYRPRIFQIAIQYLKSSELAQEVVQEVFLKTWVERDSLAKINSLQAWLFKITKNNVLNKLKRLAIESKAKDFFYLNTNTIDTETEDIIYNNEYRDLLNYAIQSLPEQQRKVFELSRVEKMSYEKIAHHLQLSPLTVKTHMARALKSIRTKMSEHGVHIPIILFFIQDFFSSCTP